MITPMDDSWSDLSKEGAQLITSIFSFKANRFLWTAFYVPLFKLAMLLWRARARYTWQAAYG